MAAGVFEGLDTVIIRVHDVDAAAAWYREKLELEASFEDPEARLVVFDLGGSTSVTLWQLARIDVPMVPGAATAYPVFSVVDVEHVWNTLRDRGVLVEPVVESGGVRWFQFRDLDGNRLEACQVV
ncbi:MAG: VOC family protein [Trueperaceae bacterium]|nr:MAG: VOC family protein [Trueperaceae bacterium]